MKPLLILAPSPARWPPFERLLAHEDPLWLDDIRKRLIDGVSGGRDAFVAVSDGGHVLAGACIRRRHDVGVLSHLFTQLERRQRGYARLLLQTLLSWFDMTGGKWLYLTSPAGPCESLLEKFGFGVLRRHRKDEQERTTMLRTRAHVPDNPFERRDDQLKIREVTRADWALLVALLQHRRGPDPRVSLDESAVTAETTALELINQQEHAACRLVAARCDERIVGLGSVALDQTGPRTYAMLMPHDQPPAGLREAVLERARQQGYEQVDFPMEGLAQAPGETPPRPEAAPPEADSAATTR
jgi:GNAT superfamily N-acetyltransferase